MEEPFPMDNQMFITTSHLYSFRISLLQRRKTNVKPKSDFPYIELFSAIALSLSLYLSLPLHLPNSPSFSFRFHFLSLKLLFFLFITVSIFYIPSLSLSLGFGLGNYSVRIIYQNPASEAFSLIRHY